MKTLILLLTLLSVSTQCFSAPIYTGKVENLRMTGTQATRTGSIGPARIEGTVVITDENNIVVLRQPIAFATGTLTEADIRRTLQEKVQRFTHDAWAHTENAQAIMDVAPSIEAMRFTSETFVPSPQRDAE